MPPEINNTYWIVNTHHQYAYLNCVLIGTLSDFWETLSLFEITITNMHISQKDHTQLWTNEQTSEYDIRHTVYSCFSVLTELSFLFPSSWVYSLLLIGCVLWMVCSNIIH